MLLDRGMDEEEAKKFVDGRKVITKGLQLPPDQALELMTEMSKYGILHGPVRFFVVITEDNEQRLLELIKSTFGDTPLILGSVAGGDVSEDPIGDYVRTIRDGFSGSAGLNVDPSKLGN